MPPLPPDPGDSAAGIQAELGELRRSIEALDGRLGDLTAQNEKLRDRLEHSERARADLLAQTEHVIQLLADARRELRKREGGDGTT